MLHLQEACGIQHQRQGGLLRIWITHVFVFISWICEKQAQFFTAGQSLKGFRLKQVYVRMVLFSLRSVCCWIHCIVDQPREIVSVMDARESFRLIHILTLVYLSPSTTFRPTFPTAPTQPQLYIFEDTAAVFQMINKGRSQILRHVTRMHRVDMDYLFERE